MNETEKKMLEYLQGLIDAHKQYKETYNKEHFEIDYESAKMYLERFFACANMFYCVTGKNVSIRNWKATIIEE